MKLVDALKKFFTKSEDPSSGIEKSDQILFISAFADGNGNPEGFVTHIKATPYIALGMIDQIMDELEVVREKVREVIESTKDSSMKDTSFVDNNPMAKVARVLSNPGKLKALIEKMKTDPKLMARIQDPNITDEEKKKIIDEIFGTNVFGDDDDDVTNALKNRTSLRSDDRDPNIEKFMKKFGENLGDDTDLSEDDIINL